MVRRLFWRLSRGLVLGLVPGLLVIGASGAHPAFATFVTDIQNRDSSGPCLSQENVGPVIDRCDGSERQDWKLVNVPGHPNDNLIRNAFTGDCLSILNNDPNPGGEVNTHACDFSGGNPFELWTNPNGTNWIANEGDGGLVMAPSGCGTAADLHIFMNFPVCPGADTWNFDLPS